MNTAIATPPVNTDNELSLIRSVPVDIKDLNLKFKTYNVSIGDMDVAQSEDYDGNKMPSHKDNLLATKIVLPDGSTKATTSRFWNSLASRAGISPNIFNLFSHKEVFERIKKRNVIKHNKLQLTERVDKEALLGIATLNKPVIEYDSLLETLNKNKADRIQYCDGVICSLHNLVNDTTMKIVTEQWKPRIWIESPIDGYGDVNTYMGILRTACTNSLMMIGAKFKSQIKVGKKDDDAVSAINRVLSSYSNDDGFNAVALRLQAAAVSTLSVEEFIKIYTIMLDNVHTSVKSAPVMASIRNEFKNMVGNLHNMYGITNLDALSVKQRKLLPTKTRVMDAINFTTEFTTHIMTRASNNDVETTRKLSMLLCEMLSSDFDLENIYPQGMNKDIPFKDFYFSTN